MEFLVWVYPMSLGQEKAGRVDDNYTVSFQEGLYTYAGEWNAVINLTEFYAHWHIYSWTLGFEEITFYLMATIADIKKCIINKCNEFVP